MNHSQKHYRDPVAVAKGLGSAHKGVHHWWMQRASAVALIPLTLWMVICFGIHLPEGYDGMVAWIGHPWNAGLLIITLCSMLYHSILGLQVIIEDYIHRNGYKMALLILIQWGGMLLALVATLSILTVMIGEI